MVDSKSYITIPYWMRENLKLSGNELMIFAIIYGFSQDGESKFTGSAEWLADWIGSTRRTVYSILKSLKEKNLIIGEERIKKNNKFIDYKANIQHEKISGTIGKFFSGGYENFSHHNNSIHNIEDIKEEIYKEEKKKSAEICYEFKDGDVDDIDKFIKVLDEWFEYKRSRKSMYKTQQGVTKFIQTLIKYSNKRYELAQEIVDISIANNYQGIFPLKGRVV